MRVKLRYGLLVLSTLFTAFGCIEEIGFETESLESALVVEATITNENKFQEVLLSRTYKFEDDGPSGESGAQVTIESDMGNFQFTENENGTYVSTQSFAAEEGVDYTLKIRTQDGRSYISNPTQQTAVSEIESVYATRETTDIGVDGMSVFIDTFDPTGSSLYYRYEYEETYKIIAPKWTTSDLIVTNEANCDVEVVNRTQEEQTCYGKENSVLINVATTSGFSEDRLVRHRVRFLDSDDPKIARRYSLLVKQYVQSLEAYSYYKTLKDFSGNGSLFSQTQPGFFSGNISSEVNPDEKVLGFFDVSTVSSKRVFFNYEDYYPGEPLPPYFRNCIEFAPDQYTIDPNICGLLITELLRNRIKYFAVNNNPPSGQQGPYLVVIRACGDCTALGSNVVPDFWEE